MTSFGIVLALVQGLWAIGWVVYVVWLPGLVQQAGMLADWVPWLLILDQWVFALSDLVCGVAADRLRRQLRRFGPWLMAMMGLSALAFLLLPWAAKTQTPTLFLVLTLVWTASSSALRAPVMALLGRHVSAQQLAWPTGLWLFGLGVAGALAPYVQPRVRELSPTLAFALPAVALMLAASALIWAERQLGRTESPPPTAAPSAPAPLTEAATTFGGLPGWVLFLGAVGLAAIGFQIHFPVNAAPQFLQLNPSATLETLLPLFWVGFNLALWPASRLSQRLGGVGTMAVGCTVAAWASAAGGASDTLPALIACQVLAGAAWACVLLSASSAATNAGRTGYEGLASGGCFALLALAAMARMTMAAGQGFHHPGVVPWLNVAPAFSWMLAAVLLLVLWRRQRCERGA